MLPRSRLTLCVKRVLTLVYIQIPFSTSLCGNFFAGDHAFFFARTTILEETVRRAMMWPLAASITITPYLVDGGVPVIDQDRLDGCAEVMNGLHADLQMRYADDQVTQSHVLHSLCRCLLHRATCSPRHIHQAKLARQEADGLGCYAHSVILTAPRSSLVPHHSMLATPCSHNQFCESVSAGAVQKDSVSSVGFSCSL